MPEKKSLIVFDIDGTLTDTVSIHQTAFKAALTSIGVTAFNDKFGTYKHHTDFHIARVIYETAVQKNFDAGTSRQFEELLYEWIGRSTILEIAGAKNFIESIEQESEFGICYATGSMYLPAKFKLEQIGIGFHPMQLVASNDIEERESIVGQAIKNAKQHYGVEKFERIISFGDGLWDLKTANNLSLEFVGIGTVNELILRDNGMTVHYPDFTTMSVSEL